MDKNGEKITLLWVIAHMGIPGNEAVSEEAKTALEENVFSTEKYPT
jgi:ribonuclease HI